VLAFGDSRQYLSDPQAQKGGELFSERSLQRHYLREGLPMNKTIALSVVIAASLGLAACAKKDEGNAMNNAVENVTNAADNTMNAAMNADANVANAANATENATNAQ
jgi:hypothetical protein